MKRIRMVWLVLALALAPVTAFAETGDVTVRDKNGLSAPVLAGGEVATTDDAVSRFKVDGVARAVTIPCPTCKTTRSGVVAREKNKTALQILHGGIALDVDHLHEGSTFELRSPVAVAAVRGTSFAGYVHHDGGETYFVGRGAVDVTVRGTEVRQLKPGEALDIAADGTVSARPAKPEELAILKTVPEK